MEDGTITNRSSYKYTYCIKKNNLNFHMLRTNR